jgi:hypothetical protein
VPLRLSFAAAAAVIFTLAGCGSEPQPVAAPVPTFAPAAHVTCNEEAYTAHPPATGWQHPQQNFYAPGEQAPTEKDLQHLLSMDAAMVVRYRPDAPKAARKALQDWAPLRAAIVVQPARAANAYQVEAFTVNRHLICDGVDPKQLSTFADSRGSLQVVPHGDSG